MNYLTNGQTNRTKHLTNMNNEMLNNIKDRIAKCTKCDLCKTRNLTVAGEGMPNSKLMFIGEAPGEVNNEVGRPFVGHGGKIFDKILENLNIKRSEVFITNILKCWPPDNRKPKPNEIKECTPYLHEQIEAVKPQLIIALGQTAFTTLTNTKIKTREEHGKVVSVNGMKVCCTYHPNGIRYVKGGMQTIINDIKAALEGIGDAVTPPTKNQLTFFNED